MKRNLLFAMIFTLSVQTFAQVKIGDNSDAINPTAMVEVESSTKGFLPPRMSTDERNKIFNPSEGLVIYNTTTKCLNWFNKDGWYDYCTKEKEMPTEGFFNTVCSNKTISTTGCGGQTSLEYNGKNYDLVEINGQCWFADNLNEVPSNFNPSPQFENYNYGWSGYYGGVPNEREKGEGLLYQWGAAMNGQTEERSQGACPSGWHIPSDCEFMYLENSLGMTVSEQNDTRGMFWRGTDQGQQLKSDIAINGIDPESTNQRKFNGILLGYRFGTGEYRDRGYLVDYITSTSYENQGARIHYFRSLEASSKSVYRSSRIGMHGASVRCLKD